MKFTAGVLLIFLLNSPVVMGQTEAPGDSVFVSTDSIALDMDLLQDLKRMLDSMSRKTSFFTVSLGAGNRLFSVKNNNFNAQQRVSRIAFTPGVFYYHKSGFGLSALAYIGKPEGKAEFYQYAFSPSYDYLYGKNISFGLSYTYYLKNKELSEYTTPFNHELFGYLQTRKGWLKAGFSAGWAIGNFVDVATVDTVIFNIPRRITDTANIDLQDFSLTASASHSFDWSSIFKRTDGISIVPQVMLVAGAQQFEINSKKTFTSRRRFLTVSRNYKNSSLENTGLRIQSAAFSISASYYIGGFSISPGYFFSYYFPETDNPVSNIFSVTAGYMF